MSNVIEGSKVITFLLFILISSIMTIIRHVDYKVVLLEDKVIFYKLFKKKKVFNYTDITNISIKGLDMPSRIIGMTKVLCVLTENNDYRFNIHNLDEDFILQVSHIAQRHNIEVIKED